MSHEIRECCSWWARREAVLQARVNDLETKLREAEAMFGIPSRIINADPQRVTETQVLNAAGRTAPTTLEILMAAAGGGHV